MALTPSNMLALGTVATDFYLPDCISGKMYALSELKGAKATLVMFICNHCPYVIHIENELVKLGQDFYNSEVSIIAISSNAVEQYPEDAPDKMAAKAKKLGFKFVYLHDESQQVAKAYQAACTPDFYLFDQNLMLVYRGQLDDSRPGNNVLVTGESIRGAIQAVLAGKSIQSLQKPSMGCNIKWR